MLKESLRGDLKNVLELMKHYENNDLPYCDLERNDVLVLAGGVIIARIPTIEIRMPRDAYQALRNSAAGEDM